MCKDHLLTGVGWNNFGLMTLWQGIRASVAFWKTPLGLMRFGPTVAFAISCFHGQVERVLTQAKNLTTWIMLCAAGCYSGLHAERGKGSLGRDSA